MNNTIDLSGQNVSFGIAFRTYKNNNGVKTADLLDIDQELKMYKEISQKLKKERFIKTKYGIQSANMKLEKDSYIKKSPSLRYNDATGNYFFNDGQLLIKNVSNAFKSLYADFEQMFNKK